MSDIAEDKKSDVNAEKETFKAALIVIGDEILAGRTQDTNTPWIAERLTEHGVALAEVRTIPDNESMIVKTINDIRSEYDYVFTTGGIGPTHDDITSASVAKAFGIDIERNAEAFRILEDHYGLEELTPPRAKMSLIPVGAKLIPNPVTAAPGFALENVYVMAGVPRIMQAMLDHILGTIQSGVPILSHTVSCSLAESTLAPDLEQLQISHPTISIGSYPNYRGGALGLSLVLRGTSKETLKIATEELIEMIRAQGDEPRAVSMKSTRDK